jgi:zinc protease
MKTSSLIPLLFALTSAGLVQAQDGAKIIEPEAKATLEKSVAAIGSKEAMSKIKTRTSIGKAEMPAQGMSMSLVIKQKAPLMYYSKAVIPEVITVEQGFDGEEGWSKDSIQGSRKLAGAELAQAKEGSAMFFEQQVLADLVEAKVLPDSKDGEQTFTVVEAKTNDDSTKTLYFDKDTNLLARVITKAIVGPDGEMEMDMQVSEYKEVDGIQIPYSMTMTIGAQKVVMTMSEIEHNLEIADDLFKMTK